MDSVLGSTIETNYHVLFQLGAGGAGTVYKAEDKQLARFVAIKIRHSSALTDFDSLKRFEREGKLLARLQHKNIVQLYSTGVLASGAPYMVMEFIDGISLDKLIQGKEFLERAQVIDLAIQICDALRAAHIEGIVHRDLKPQNLIVDETILFHFSVISSIFYQATICRNLVMKKRRNEYNTAIRT